MSPKTANLDTPAPLRILLVEDDEFDVAVFRRAFRKSGVPCEIVRCRRGEEALEGLQITGLELDLLVTDHKLPGMTGLELSKLLLENKPSFAIVLLTGGGSEEVAIEALKAGVHDYIVKDSSHEYLSLLPLMLPQAVRRHHDHVARKKAERELRASQDAVLDNRRRRVRLQEDTSEAIRQKLHQLQRDLEQLTLNVGKSVSSDHLLSGLRHRHRELTQLFESLLEAARYDAQQQEGGVKSFDLGDLVRSALEALTLPPEAAARDLFYVLAPDVPEKVLGNPQQLKEMIVRLVESLLQQSDGGELTVQVGRHDMEGCLRFDIGGKCLFMQAKSRQRLMAAFNLSEEETMAGAFSVELMECRDLARRLGGSIWVEAAPSTEADPGTEADPRTEVDPSAEADPNAELGDQAMLCFSAELPAVEFDSTVAVNEPSGESSWWETSGDGTRAGRQRLEPRVLEVDRHPAQVLVVSANSVVIHVVGRMVEQMGCRFVPVESGDQALNALAREPFDLVLTCLDLPHMSGLELTRKIRGAGGCNAGTRDAATQAAGHRLPIIALGTRAEEQEACRQAGLDGLIRRPLSVRQVESSVRRALRDRI